MYGGAPTHAAYVALHRASWRAYTCGIRRVTSGCMARLYVALVYLSGRSQNCADPLLLLIAYLNFPSLRYSSATRYVPSAAYFR